MSDIVGILLAAGRGQRFGSDKLLHPLPDGTPLALVAARRLRSIFPRCVSVLRPEQAVLGELLLDEGFTVHFSPEVAAGMGHSLAAAVRSTPTVRGWVVALADMPLIRPGTLTLVADALLDGASIAAPFFDERRGHPVGFANHWYARLSTLNGDQGARDLLAIHDDLLTRLPVTDEGIHFDVDQPAALDLLLL